jgi:hypothetical protein
MPAAKRLWLYPPDPCSDRARHRRFPKHPERSRTRVIRQPVARSISRGRGELQGQRRRVKGGGGCWGGLPRMPPFPRGAHGDYSVRGVSTANGGLNSPRGPNDSCWDSDRRRPAWRILPATASASPRDAVVGLSPHVGRVGCLRRPACIGGAGRARKRRQRMRSVSETASAASSFGGQSGPIGVRDTRRGGGLK